MKTPSKYERFPMLNSAWNTAVSLVDDKGNLLSALKNAEAKFLKRKVCQDLAEDDCKAVFHTAVEIARAAHQFRRSNCGSLTPKPARRYELLFSMAKALESRFPNGDNFLILAGCRTVEVFWDR